MKKINLLFLCLMLLPRFISGYVAPVWNFPCQTWQPTLNLKEEKHITVIIPSYKNADWYEYNLASVFAQKYSNYSVVYIDDCSSDNTAKLVQEYVIKQNQQHRFTLIANQKRMGALSNIYRAVHATNPQSIIVTLDGDDWLAHYHVFTMLNEAYEDQNVWLTYGQFAIFPQYVIGFCREIPKEVIDRNVYRHYLWSTSHLRTFYAWLFQEIKLADLMSNGIFYPMAWDLAFMYPMLEMSRGRFKFLPHVNYLYNIATPINDHKVNISLQTQLGYEVGRKQKYSELSYPGVVRSKNDTVSLIIFSYNRPLQLYALLESIQKYMKGLESIAVLYRADSDRFAAAYDKVKSTFATLSDAMTWQRQQNPPHDFKELLLSLLDAQTSPYLMFAVDDNILKDAVDLHICMKYMQCTKAYGFFLRLGEHITHCYS
ncbi:MAG TPA: glycosyltransferase family A protein, partial [Candidatus Babeliales bacterium]|nr:glycosyltransferase family A protein [Candidatus Babeliales bacterium]